MGMRAPFEATLRPKERVRPRVLIGASLFGIGWGVAGLCPGPAVTDLASLNGGVLLFFGPMLLGIWGVKLLSLLIKK